MTPTIVDRKTIPPDVASVEAYCQQRKNQVDPQLFHDHYEARGWMIGKTKMKDWQAAVRTWERNGYSIGEIQLKPRHRKTSDLNAQIARRGALQTIKTCRQAGKTDAEIKRILATKGLKWPD